MSNIMKKTGGVLLALAVVAAAVLGVGFLLPGLEASADLTWVNVDVRGLTGTRTQEQAIKTVENLPYDSENLWTNYGQVHFTYTDGTPDDAVFGIGGDEHTLAIWWIADDAANRGRTAVIPEGTQISGMSDGYGITLVGGDLVFTVDYDAEAEKTYFPLTKVNVAWVVDGNTTTASVRAGLPLEMPEIPAGKVLLGWRNAAGDLLNPTKSIKPLTNETYTAVLSDFAVTAVTPRLSDPAGVQFTTTVPATLKAMENVTFGAEITSVGSSKSVDIPTADFKIAASGGAYTYDSAIVNIYPQNYVRVYYCNAYANVTYTDGSSAKIYAVPSDASELGYSFAQLVTETAPTSDWYKTIMNTVYKPAVDVYYGRDKITSEATVDAAVDTALSSVTAVKIGETADASVLSTLSIDAYDDNTVLAAGTCTGTMTARGLHIVLNFSVENVFADNTSEYQILRSPNADENEVWAATEIQTFVAEATGVTLPIVTLAADDPTVKYISVGETDLAASGGYVPAYADVLENGFKMATDGKHIYVSGADSVGTRNGAYELLEKLVDYDCYGFAGTYSYKMDDYGDYVLDDNNNRIIMYYGVDGVEATTFEEAEELSEYIVPVATYAMSALTADLADDGKTDGLYVPSFNWREANYGEFHHTPHGVTLAHRMRFNMATDMYVYGLDYHNSFDIMPVDTYYAAHPDWYSHDTSGNTIYEPNGAVGQLCYSNAAMKAQYIANLLEDLESIDKPVLMLGMEDHVDGWCACADCQATISAYGAASATIALFMNDVTAAVTEWCEQNGRNPMKVLFFAYYEAESAPTVDIALHENLGVMFAPIKANFYVPMNNTAYHSTFTANADAYNSMERWAELMTGDANMHAWFYSLYSTYSLNSFDTFGNLYTDAADTFCTMQENYRWLQSLGTNSVLDQTEHWQSATSGFARLKAYVMSKLQWDVNADVKALVNKFMTHYYGAGASEMQAVFEAAQAYSWERYDGGWLDGSKIAPGKITCNVSASSIWATKFWDEDTLTGYIGRINAAYTAAAGNSLAQYRIRLDSLNYRYYLLRCYNHSNNLFGYNVKMAWNTAYDTRTSYIEEAERFGIDHYSEAYTFEYKPWSA